MTKEARATHASPLRVGSQVQRPVDSRLRGNDGGITQRSPVAGTATSPAHRPIQNPTLNWPTPPIRRANAHTRHAMPRWPSERAGGGTEHESTRCGSPFSSTRRFGLLDRRLFRHRRGLRQIPAALSGRAARRSPAARRSHDQRTPAGPRLWSGASGSSARAVLRRGLGRRSRAGDDRGWAGEGRAAGPDQRPLDGRARRGRRGFAGVVRVDHHRRSLPPVGPADGRRAGHGMARARRLPGDAGVLQPDGRPGDLARRAASGRSAVGGSRRRLAAHQHAALISASRSRA